MKRFSEEQIIGFLRETEAGLPVKELCRRHGFSEASYYLWRNFESFNGRLRDECLNEHWFTSLLHARTVIETWRRKYNEERPKKALGGLTPSACAKQMAIKADTINPGL